jgi:sperm-associated antigen 1
MFGKLFCDAGLGRDALNLSTLYSNRAACLLKVGDCQGCIIDCDSALALCPGTAKALLRRAMAYETLEK